MKDFNESQQLLCPHSSSALWGKTRNGNQRRRCHECGGTFTLTVFSKVERTREILLPLFLRGSSIRQATRATEMSRITIGRYFRAFRASGLDPKCGCGQPANHRGWCAVRFGASESRQAMMRTMQQKNKEIG